MPRKPHTPSYRLHKQSGQAIVTLPDGRGGRHDVLLGPYDSEESKREYKRIVVEWVANGWREPTRTEDAPDLTMNELLMVYFAHAETYYRHPDGTPTSEVDNIRLALRPLKELYGDTEAGKFDSLALEAVRVKMIEAGHCRKRINKDVDRIKRMFRWATAKKLVPLETYQLLQTVENLQAGRSEAHETEPVKPVAEEVVEATLPFCTPQVAAMIRLQLLAGMRPGEVTIMRSIDISTSGKLWTYRPGSDRGAHGKHKNAWRGHDKVILLGPRAQAVLAPWLRANVTEYLFQPREAMAAFRAEQRRQRKSKVTPSQANRKPKSNPKRVPGDRYKVSRYDQAVSKAVEAANKAQACEACKEKPAEERCQACQAAAIPHWHPNQLRHAKATEIRRVAGIDAARVVLGHKSPAITEVYAELDRGKAAEIIERLG